MNPIECPFCGGAAGDPEEIIGIYAVRCLECGANGPVARTRTEAIKGWNEGTTPRQGHMSEASE